VDNKFSIDECAILNNNAKGLSYNIGDRVKIKRKRKCGQYDYDIELPNGDIVFVKESELKKLTQEDIKWMSYIFTDNKVKYGNEIAKVVKADYLIILLKSYSKMKIHLLLVFIMLNL
jgi:hypothetical protein